MTTDAAFQEKASIDFAVLAKVEIRDSPTFAKVESIASALRDYLNEEQAQQLILERHILNG